MTPESNESIKPAVPMSTKILVLTMLGVPYLAFVVICFALITILPSETGEFDKFIAPGMFLCSSAILALLAVFTFGMLRTLKKPNVVPAQLIGSAIRLGLFALPGIGLAGLTMVTIIQEPALYLTVKDPPAGTELVAPLSITFSAQKATETLALKDVKVLQYSWDFNGDKQADLPPSINPEATFAYDRPGIYSVVAVLQLSTGESRAIPYSFAIPKATIAVEPKEPIIDEPVALSVGHLFSEEQVIQTVKWSFGDGVEADVTQSSVEHTFTQLGTYTIVAVVRLENGTEQRFERDITVSSPPPLPFPISISTTPERLISPPPFSAIFRVETEEELESIVWEFEEGQKREGLEARYTYLRQGDYTVTLNVANKEGKRVRLTKLVRVVPELQINDLVFQGDTKISVGNLQVIGEQPVKIDLTPISESQPFVEYYWDARDATVIVPSDNPYELQAIYRYPGTYRIGLLVQDPGGKAKRFVIPVTVEERKADVDIRLSTAGGEAPLNVTFDVSETFIPGEQISGFEWLFGDQENELPQQGGAVASHLYTEPGTYTVQMTVTTTAGNQYMAEKTLVVRPPNLNACFTPSRPSGVAPMGVIFDSSCTSGLPDKYNWDFGDGSTSDLKTPTHIFESPGVYSVELNLNDKFDSKSKTSVNITVYEAS